MKICLLLFFVTSINCGFSQKTLQCNDFSVNLKLLSKGREIENVDTRFFDSIPERIDLNLILVNEAWLYTRSKVETVKMELYLYFKMSESYDCIYPINPVFTTKRIIFERKFKHEDFVVSKASDGSAMIDLKDILFKSEIMKFKTGKRTTVNEAYIECKLSSESGKVTCINEYHRQLCTQAPISVIPGR